VMQPNFQQPMVQQANLNLEHQLANDLSITVGGQFVKGNHLQRTRDINLGTTAPTVFTFSTSGSVTVNRYPGNGRLCDPAGQVRPVPAFCRILEFESTSNSLYHGGFIQLKKRMAHNFQGMVSYTFSHVIDDVPDATAVVPGTDDSKMLFDPKCDRCDRASGVNDARHRFVLSGIWQLNYGKSLPLAARQIVGGWEMSTIFSYQTGLPYTAKVGGDLNNDGNSSTDRVPTLGRDSFRLPSKLEPGSALYQDHPLHRARAHAVVRGGVQHLEPLQRVQRAHHAVLAQHHHAHAAQYGSGRVRRAAGSAGRLDVRHQHERRACVSGGSEDRVLKSIARQQACRSNSLVALLRTACDALGYGSPYYAFKTYMLKTNTL